jgi:hypothetical protein
MSEIDILEAQLRDLIEKIQGIDLQLTQRKTEIDRLRERLPTPEFRPYRHDYETWRSSALKARQEALNDHGRLKAMLHQAHTASREDERDILWRAIADHRQKTYDGDYEPTAVDLELWDHIDRPRP